MRKKVVSFNGFGRKEGRQVLVHAMRFVRSGKKGSTRRFDGTAITIETISFTTKDQALFDKTSNHFYADEDLEFEDATTGSGPLKFTGVGSTDQGIFLGENAVIGSKTIKFLGVEGEPHFKSFVGILEEGDYEKLKVTQIKYNYNIDSTAEFSSASQLEDAQLESISTSRNTRPELNLKNGILSIGKRGSSTTYVGISGIKGTGVGVISGLAVELHLSAQAAETFFTTLVTNETFDLKNQAALFMLEAMKNVTSSPLIERIRKMLRDNFELGSIVILRKQELTVNPSVKYAITSLSAIKKRLCDPLISKEVQVQVTKFVSEIPGYGDQIPDYDSFIKKLQEVSGKIAVGSTTKRATKATKATRAKAAEASQDAEAG